MAAWTTAHTGTWTGPENPGDRLMVLGGDRDVVVADLADVVAWHVRPHD